MSELTNRVKAKYPQYQNIPDNELESRVLAKYPQYKSLATPTDTASYVAGTAKNIIPSAIKTAKEIGSFVVNTVNPNMEKNSIMNMSKLAQGAGQLLDPTKGNKLVQASNKATSHILPFMRPLLNPKNENLEQMPKSVGKYYADAYGSPERIRQTVYSNPVGVAADIASVATGVGGLGKAGASAAAKAGQMGVASQLAKAGNTLYKAGMAADPILAAGKGIGLGSSKLFSRVKPAVVAADNTSDINRLKTIASREGVELPLSATTNNQFVRQGEALAGKGLFGRKISSRFEQAGELPNKILSKVTNENKADVSATKNALGQTVINELKTFSRGFKDKASAIYDNIEQTLGDAPVAPVKTKEMIAKLLKQQEMSALPQGQSQKLYQSLLGNLDQADTYAKLNQTRKDIGQLMNSTDPLASGQQAQLKAIYGAIQSDLDNVSKVAKDAEVGQALKIKTDMDAKWKEFTTLLNKQEGRQVLSDVTDIEDIVPRIYKPNNVSSIKRLKQFVTPQTFKELGDTLLTEIVNSAIGKDGLIDPDKWVTTMRKWDKPTLTEAVGASGVKKLDQITKVLDDANFAKKQLSNSTRAYSGSQTAMLANTGLGGGSFTASLLTLNPVPFLTYLGANALGAGLFGSNAGRQIMSAGVKTPKLFSRVPVKSGANTLYQTGRAGRMVQE